MLQFIPPKLTVTPPIKSRPIQKPKLLDPSSPYVFASTHIDAGGCSHYRILFISQLLSQFHIGAHFFDTRILFSFRGLFPLLSSYRLQRACSIQDLEWLNEMILPAKEKYHFPVVYEIDDILVLEDIPVYNCFRDIFVEGKDSIPIYMNGSDAITVTCEPLANYYSTKFGIPREKFHVIPNYLPRYFFDSYNEVVILDRLSTQKKRRPRICFSCGLSHFDMKRTGAGDDFTGILDWIVENRRKYQFIFHGGFPPALEPYKKDFERITVSSFLNYPRIRRAIHADLYIQPLQHSLFNECKSPIKLLESWAEGTPAFVQDLGCYMNIAPDACFDTPEKLDRMVKDLFSDQVEQFRIIRSNYARMDNWWLDNHLDDWLEVMLYPNGRPETEDPGDDSQTESQDGQIISPP